MTTVNWKTGKGQQVTVTVNCELYQDIVDDGWDNKIETGKYVIITEIRATVDGLGVVGESSGIDSVATNDRGIVGSIGKLALTNETYEMVENAIAEEKEIVANNDEYKKYLARIESAEKADAEYQRHYDAIAKAMSV